MRVVVCDEAGTVVGVGIATARPREYLRDCAGADVVVTAAWVALANGYRAVPGCIGVCCACWKPGDDDEDDEEDEDGCKAGSGRWGKACD